MRIARCIYPSVSISLCLETMLVRTGSFSASFAPSRSTEDRPTLSSDSLQRPRARSTLSDTCPDPLRSMDSSIRRESAAALTPNHFLKAVLENKLKVPEDRHKTSLVRPSSSAYNALYCGYKLGRPQPFHDPSKVFRVFQQSKPAHCSTLQLPRPRSSCPGLGRTAVVPLDLRVRALAHRYMRKYEFDPEAMQQLRQLYECVRRREPRFGSCRANSVLPLGGQMQAVVDFLLRHEKKLGVREALKGETLSKFERLLLHLQRDVFL